MTPEPAGSLTVDGELTAETSGVPTVLSGSGSHVRWDLVDAETVLRNLAVSRATLRWVGDMSEGLGLTIEIVEGDRPLLDVGTQRSLLGRLIYGSDRVRPRSVLRLLRLSIPPLAR